MKSHTDDRFILPDGSGRVIKLTKPLAELECSEVLAFAYTGLTHIIKEFNQDNTALQIGDHVIIDLLETLLSKLERYYTLILYEDEERLRAGKKTNDYQALRHNNELESAFNDVCGLTVIQLLSNTKRMLHRIQNDFHKLEMTLLNSLTKNSNILVISKIRSTGNDTHHGGENVIILSFMNESNDRVQIIYKPTSILQDAMLVGDLYTLSKIDNYFENSSSMLERIAKGMNENSPDLHFNPTTYFILPCKSGESNYDYGYIEFLSQNEFGPHEKETLDNEKMEAIRNSKNSEVHTFVNNELVKLYNVSENNEISDNITEHKEDIKNWSYHCGVLCFLMLATGCSDPHNGNLIIHELLPHLIDNEICLSHQGPTSALLCLAPNGSMRNELYEYGELYALSEKKCIHKQLPTLAKNLLYFKEGNNLTACSIIKESFIQGLHDALNSLNYDYVRKWFDQPQVKDMIVRFLLVSTDQMKQLPNHYLGLSPHLDLNYIKEYLNALKLNTQMELESANYLFFPTEGGEVDYTHLNDQFKQEVILPLIEFITSDDIIKSVKELDVPTFKSTPNQTLILCELYKIFIDNLTNNLEFREIILHDVEKRLNELPKDEVINKPAQINQIIFYPIGKYPNKSEIEMNTIYLISHHSGNEFIAIYHNDETVISRSFDKLTQNMYNIGFPLNDINKITIEENSHLIAAIAELCDCVPIMGPPKPQPTNETYCNIS